MASDPCLFCAIVRHEVSASIVREDDATIAFMDLHPINPGHTLVIPKLHSVEVSGIPAAIGGKVFAAGMAVAAALRASGLRCEGVNFFLADGVAAGQEVFHVHLHLIPRFANDGFGLKRPKGSGAAAARSELDRIASLLHGALPK
jgi:histidine triad (HIT) family protein